MWIVNNSKNWNKHKWCRTKLGSRRQKYLALLQEMNNMFFPIICGNQMVNDILHIRAHPSIFYPPPYDSLLDNLTNGIAPLLPIKLNPFHPFHFIVQESLAFHNLLNKLEIQPYTIYGCLFASIALCIKNYCCNNVANMVMVFSLPILQILPCHFKILTNGLTLP